MIRQADPAPYPKARQIKITCLFRQRVENRQVTTLGKEINPPIGNFVPRRVEERRTAQLDAAKNRIVAKHFAFEIAASRSEAAAAKLLPTYQRQISNLPLYFPVQLKSFGKLVCM